MSHFQSLHMAIDTGCPKKSFKSNTQLGPTLLWVATLNPTYFVVNQPHVLTFYRLKQIDSIIIEDKFLFFKSNPNQSDNGFSTDTPPRQAGTITCTRANESDIIIQLTPACPELIYSYDLQCVQSTCVSVLLRRRNCEEVIKLMEMSHVPYYLECYHTINRQDQGQCKEGYQA